MHSSYVPQEFSPEEGLKVFVSGRKVSDVEADFDLSDDGSENEAGKPHMRVSEKLRRQNSKEVPSEGQMVEVALGSPRPKKELTEDQLMNKVNKRTNEKYLQNMGSVNFDHPDLKLDASTRGVSAPNGTPRRRHSTNCLSAEDVYSLSKGIKGGDSGSRVPIHPVLGADSSGAPNRRHTLGAFSEDAFVPQRPVTSRVTESANAADFAKLGMKSPSNEASEPSLSACSTGSSSVSPSSCTAAACLILRQGSKESSKLLADAFPTRERRSSLGDARRKRQDALAAQLGL